MIEQKDIEYVAFLAKLELSETEKKSLAKDLENILDYVKLLNEIDTNGVEATSHVISLKNVLREDVVKPSLPREEFLETAPDASEEGFLIPSVIEG